MAKPYLWLKAVVPLFAVCVWFRGTGLANGSLGYLPTVGPVPVRFQPLLPAVPTAPWPPLRQQELPVTKTEAQMTNSPAAVASATGSTATAPLSSGTDAETSAAPPPSPQPDAITPFPVPASSLPSPATAGEVDPQALLTYLLSVSTNKPGVKVIMPAFIPPAPPAPFASSHATSETR